ncbi:phage tail tube protein [Sedimenticola selenatireducens]|uniref:Phage tail protein n=1 Tax=Sedimenticola selenatireducens TaxID=191960 RepID=A0A558E0X9_9GAMM|nr:phage tail tube protein [Sedimenticola selenatireducens]TVO75139.1 phage tail protein [Sedimenticola selenatireducens]TVT67006.1 MAG: phage tail protein [Sedimenticola selenatireducens]
MPSPKIWSNVQVAMQSVLATADTITGITKANPGVVTSTGHGILDGEYVVLTSVGMSQLDQRVVRAANVTANTFELEGVDTTNFDTFTSGSCQVITFGTTFGTIKSLSGSGGDFSFVDTTTIHDSVATQIPGIASASTYSFDNIWDVADAGLIAMKAASDTKAKRAFKFTFSDGQIMVFNGYVGASLLPTGSAQDLVTTSSVVTMYGTPTYYAS